MFDKLHYFWSSYVVLCWKDTQVIKEIAVTGFGPAN